jgi:acyl carrier protein
LRQQVLAWLIDWFVSKGRVKRQLLLDSLEKDYFEAGWLTSMEVVEFVTDLEQQFGIQLEESDLQDARFLRLSGVSELVVERSAQPAGNP